MRYRYGLNKTTMVLIAAIVASAANLGALAVLVAIWLSAASLIIGILLPIYELPDAGLGYSPWMWWDATRYWSQSDMYRQVLFSSGSIPTMLMASMAARSAVRYLSGIGRQRFPRR